MRVTGYCQSDSVIYQVWSFKTVCLLLGLLHCSFWGHLASMLRGQSSSLIEKIIWRKAETSCRQPVLVCQLGEWATSAAASLTPVKLLRSECLWPPKFICCKPNAHGDIRMWRLWEVTRSQGGGHMVGISAFMKKASQSSRAPLIMRGYREEARSRNWALTRHQLCWHQDLELPSLWKCETLISVVDKLLY